ncbi:MAG: hypothetical protein JWR61_1478 [Ferruginibacter sp.]|nr:hypothetical protein [Ferruginibacter sp.]
MENSSMTGVNTLHDESQFKALCKTRLLAKKIERF